MYTAVESNLNYLSIDYPNFNHPYTSTIWNTSTWSHAYNIDNNDITLNHLNIFLWSHLVLVQLIEVRL